MEFITVTLSDLRYKDQLAELLLKGMVSLMEKDIKTAVGNGIISASDLNKLFAVVHGSGKHIYRVPHIDRHKSYEEVLELIKKTGTNRTKNDKEAYLKAHFLRPEDIIYADPGLGKPINEFSGIRSINPHDFIILAYDANKLEYRPDVKETVYALKKGVKSWKDALAFVVEVKVGSPSKGMGKARKEAEEIKQEVHDLDVLRQRLMNMYTNLRSISSYLDTEADFKDSKYHEKKKEMMTSAGIPIPVTESIQYAKINPDKEVLKKIGHAAEDDYIAVSILKRLEDFLRHHRISLHANNIKEVRTQLEKYPEKLKEAYDTYRDSVNHKKGTEIRQAAFIIGMLSDAIGYILKGDAFGWSSATADALQKAGEMKVDIKEIAHVIQTEQMKMPAREEIEAYAARAKAVIEKLERGEKVFEKKKAEEKEEEKSEEEKVLDAGKALMERARASWNSELFKPEQKSRLRERDVILALKEAVKRKDPEKIRKLIGRTEEIVKDVEGFVENKKAMLLRDAEEKLSRIEALSKKLGYRDLMEGVAYVRIREAITEKNYSILSKSMKDLESAIKELESQVRQQNAEYERARRNTGHMRTPMTE